MAAAYADGKLESMWLGIPNACMWPQASDALESFGNARTMRNPNSSRFGKWVQLHLLPSGALLGVSI